MGEEFVIIQKVAFINRESLINSHHAHHGEEFGQHVPFYFQVQGAVGVEGR